MGTEPVLVRPLSLAGIEEHLKPIDKTERELMQAGEATPHDLAKLLDKPVSTIRNHLTALRKLGRAEPADNGKWRHIPDSRSYSDQEPGIGPTVAKRHTSDGPGQTHPGPGKPAFGADRDSRMKALGYG